MADPFYESREWLDLRYRVLRRSNGCCQLCGNRGTDDAPLHCDHIEPRSKRPELALVESNIQVLCKFCNLGKSNKDNTDWRFQASPHLVERLNRRLNILKSANPLDKARLEQMDWLRKSDDYDEIRKEADKEYRTIWAALEKAYDAKGGQ